MKKRFQYEFRRRQLQVVAELVLILLLGLIGVDVYQYVRQSRTLYATMYQERKEDIREQVDRAMQYITFCRQDEDRRLRFRVKEHVYEAHAMAERLYELHADAPREEIERIIHEALYSMRWLEGKGYIFAMHLETGTMMVHAQNPTLEGTDARQLIDPDNKALVLEFMDICRNRGEGYSRYLWRKDPDIEVYSPKVSFVKLLEPLNWIIGTGEYYDDVTSETQAMVKRYLSSVRFNDGEGYIFARSYAGIELINGTQPQLVGRDLWERTDESGVHVVQEIVNAARKPEGGYVEYVWNRPLSRQPAAKISYVRGIDDWQWAIGAGLYTDQIEAAISAERVKLMKRVGAAFTVALIAAGIVLASFLREVRRIEKKVVTSFVAFKYFFTHSERRDECMQPATLPYQEFSELAENANRMMTARREMEAAMRDTMTELHEAKDRNEKILSSIQTGVVIVDAETKEIVDANPAACRMAEVTREQLVGQICHRFICPAQQNRCPITDLGDTVENAERVLLRSDGEEVPILKTVVPIMLDGRKRLLECFMDIQEQKQQQARLEEILKELETQSLVAQEMAERAAAASQAKSEFLANMSHEIRTPMNGVMSMIDLALDKGPDQQIREYLKTAKNSARNLLTLLNDILDISKIEAGKLDVEWITCSVRDILSVIDSVMQVKARSKGLDFSIRVTSSIPGQIHSDPTRLQQCLVNLVDNAIKFTEKGSVRVEVSSQFENGGYWLCFRIIDTGIGISEDQREQIFEAFTQADASTTRRYGGTGLGLTITRQLVDLLQGRITCTSGEGEGTCFLLDLPVNLESDQITFLQGDAWRRIASPEHESIKTRFTGRILVAEDDPANQLAIRVFLGEAGIDVDIAEDGQQAWDMAQGNDYDLVFMDIQMPYLDGLEVTRRLRAADYRQPIYALTAHAMAEDKQLCLAAGCNGHLTKPLDRRMILNTVADHLLPLPTDGRAFEVTSNPLARVPSNGDCPIDWDDVLERGMDTEVLQAIASAWVAESPEVQKGLAACVEKNACDDLHIQAHKLMGSAALLGAVKLAEAAHRLEEAALDENKEQINSALQGVQQEVGRLRAFLSQSEWLEAAQHHL